MPFDGDRQSSYLGAYNDLCILLASMNFDLLITHGTLLGFYRDGQMIPYDDDFDVFYISKYCNITDILFERMDLMNQLRSKFKVFISPTGNIKVVSKKHGVTLDLMTAWYNDSDSTFNIGGYSSYNCKLDDVYPFHSLFTLGFELKCVNNIVLFLENEYGSGWSFPNPSYTYIINERSLKNRVLLRPSDNEVSEFGSIALKRKRNIL